VVYPNGFSAFMLEINDSTIAQLRTEKELGLASLPGWNDGAMEYRDVEGKLFCILPKRKLRAEPIILSVNLTVKTVGL